MASCGGTGEREGGGGGGFMVKPQKENRSNFQFPVYSLKKSSVEKKITKDKTDIYFCWAA